MSTSGDPTPDGDDHSLARLDRGPAARRPRRVAVLGIIAAIAVIALVLVLHLTGVLGAGSSQ